MNKKKPTVFEKVIYYWLPVFCWAAVIFTFSANPTTSTSQIHWQDFIIKKTLHVVIYGVLATLLYRALRAHKFNKSKAGYVSIAAIFLYGITDEVHQSFTPGRMPRAYDVIFDTIGAVLAIYIIWKYFPRHRKLKEFFQKFGIS